MKSTKKLVIAVLVPLLLVGGTLYGLADRYLIKHVEKVVAEEGTSQYGSSPQETATPSEAGAKSDDWNYTSDDIQIHIDQVQTGSGADQITYYAADVQLKNSGSLLSAFADNSFGRNITENTSEIASDNGAIFAVNGDYYGFRGDGVIIRNGTLYRDEPARTGLALFNDGTMKAYDETKVSSSALLEQGTVQTLSFGPALIQDGEVDTDLDNVKIDTNFGNRSIQGANPRTGIGLIAPNHYVFVVVDGRKEGYSRGMTLTEFAQVFKDLGCTEAYNLDGGGSSTMYFLGRVVNNPQGKGRERGVSDILYVKEVN
ncbi:phosphodiester glycosidase family protein [Paenibacillus macerans]|uniref:phosphodiester glycosidase family protein n=1 Tax=Paenibacillus macerans TaxID=44252 RepID=UPI00203F2828|nr:phosphodiester glycosidase family protein [Paenibacillus macerans]MCM3703612.1 phosphodiester glycosidase family protein [Paenibacillus macerans]